MSYVECYVAAVPTANRAAYEKQCEKMCQLFREHGASRAVDCWGTNVPDGKVTSFPIAVQAKEDETVCMGWVEWPSKEVRDQGMEKAMSDERMSMDGMPFDGSRLIFAGFEKFCEV